MSQIKPSDFWMGRDITHASDLTDEIQRNGADTIEKVNLLLALAAEDGIHPGIDEITKTHVASGWRPPAINDRTANAVKGTSKHVLGLACDVEDQTDRRLAVWVCRHLKDAERIGLYFEDPRWTAGRTNSDGWVHMQTVPPTSGRRIYIPYTDIIKHPPTDAEFFQREGLRPV